MTENPTLEIELLPEERELLLKWTYPFDDLRAQLESQRSSAHLETVTISAYFLGLLIGDLAHAIVKKHCRDPEVIELCERLEYVERTGDGRWDDGY
jgi:hypothetical protein